MNYEIYKAFERLFNSIYWYAGTKYNYQEMTITDITGTLYDDKNERLLVCIEINNKEHLSVPLTWSDIALLKDYYDSRKGECNCAGQKKKNKRYWKKKFLNIIRNKKYEN